MAVKTNTTYSLISTTYSAITMHGFVSWQLPSECFRWFKNIHLAHRCNGAWRSFHVFVA